MHFYIGQYSIQFFRNLYIMTVFPLT